MYRLHTGVRRHVWTVLAGCLATWAMPLSALGAQGSPASGDPAATAEQPSQPSAPPSTGHGADGQGNTRDLFSLDIDQLGDVDVQVRPSTTNAASTILESGHGSLGQANTTAELLERASSVTLRRTSAINLDPRVRGFHSEQIGASANGMAEWKTRVDIDSLFSQIDPGIVQRIEVIDGPYSSLYGPGFAFLVADLYAAPRFEHGPEGHGSTHLTYGNNAQSIYTRQNLWAGGANWGAYGSYGLRVGGDYLTGGPGEYRIPSGYEKWDGFFAVSGDLSDRSRLEFDYLRTEINHLELPGVVYDLNNSHNDQFNLRYVIQAEPDGPQRYVLQYWLHQTKYVGDASRPAKQLTLYRQFFSLPAFDEFPVNTLGDGRSDSMGLRSFATLGESDAAQWTLGTDWRRYDQFYREYNLNAAGDLIFDGNVFGIPSSRRDNIGLFTHLLMPLTDRLSVTTGGRIDWMASQVDASDPVVATFSGPPDDYFYYPGLAEPDDMLGMAYATARWELDPAWTATCGVAYATRGPSLAELYSDEPYVPLLRFGNSYVDGNSQLQPEKNLQLDLGLSYDTERLHVATRGFHADIRDYIWTAPAFVDPSAPDFINGGQNLGRNFAFFPSRTDVGTANENADTNQAGYAYTNIDRATITGIDFLVDVTVYPWFAIGGDLAYIRGTNRAPVAAVENADGGFDFVPTLPSEPLPNIYPFHGTAWLRWMDSREDRWSVTFLSRMVQTQNRVATTLAERPTPGFAVFDVAGHYWLNDHLRMNGAIQNLLNRRYYEHGSLAIIDPTGTAVFLLEPGICVFAGAELTY